MAGPDDRDPPNDAPPPEPPASSPSTDEPRARDVARAESTADLDDKLDPATVAQLAAWFGLPSFEELEEQRKAAAAPAPEDAFTKERREIHAKIEQAVSPKLLAHIEGMAHGGDRMLADRLPPPMDVHVRDIAIFDPTFVERRTHMADAAEVDRPNWIEDAMHEAAPQAILRDLHRPEIDFTKGYPLPDPEPGLDDLTREIRETATASYKIRPDVPPGPKAMREAYEAVRMCMRGNWADLARPVTGKS